MPIYCLRAGENGPVKIGMAANLPDALKRIEYLQTAHWETLRLIRMWAGHYTEERLLHARFADLRIRGEWFAFSRQMLADVGLEVLLAPERDADAPIKVIDIVRRLGGPGDVARLCGTSVAIVSWWIRGNTLPKDKREMIVQRAKELSAFGITEAVLSRQFAVEVPRPKKRKANLATLPAASRLPPNEEAVEWLRLKKAGHTLVAIATAYGVSKQRVHQVLFKQKKIAA